MYSEEFAWNCLFVGMFIKKAVLGYDCIEMSIFIA